jgi:dihydroxyacetone kinase
LLDAIVNDLNLARDARVALMVNGLGGSAPMELAIVARAALADLRTRGVTVERAWSGNFMTAMEMPGCSLTLLPLDEERNGLFDAPADVVAWPGGGRIAADRAVVPAPKQPPAEPGVPGPLTERLRQAAFAVAAALEGAEDRLADLDARAGDGDLGASMTRGAAAIYALPAESFATPDRLLADLGNALRRAIAGSSGPFYAAALLRASASLRELPEPSARDWLAAFEAAIDAITELGGARTGDRTMIDALVPAAEAWRQGADFRGVAAAEAGAEATSAMFPALGRASYLGNRAVGTPDGGAVAVAIWLRALAEGIAE